MTDQIAHVLPLPSKMMAVKILRACLYDPGILGYLGLLIIYCYFCSCVNMETEATKIPGMPLP